jgi:hypothetical protein
MGGLGTARFPVLGEGAESHHARESVAAGWIHARSLRGRNRRSGKQARWRAGAIAAQPGTGLAGGIDLVCDAPAQAIGGYRVRAQACQLVHRQGRRVVAAVRLARVASDPAIETQARIPAGAWRWRYCRGHGAPRMYYGAYEKDALRASAISIRASRADRVVPWVIFDNTAPHSDMPRRLVAGIPQAARMKSRLASDRSHPVMRRGRCQHAGQRMGLGDC